MFSFAVLTYDLIYKNIELLAVPDRRVGLRIHIIRLFRLQFWHKTDLNVVCPHGIHCFRWAFDNTYPSLGNQATELVNATDRKSATKIVSGSNNSQSYRVVAGNSAF